MADFADRLAEFRQTTEEPGVKALRLASFRLLREALPLGRAIARKIAAGVDLAPLTPFRLTVLASATVDLMREHLTVAAARHGIALEVGFAPFDQIVQQALDPGSEANRSRPDAFLVLFDHHWLGLSGFDDLNPEHVATRIDLLRDVIDGLATHGGAPSIIPTVACPPMSMFGNADLRIAGSLRASIAAFNTAVLDLISRTGGYCLDVAALAERVGTYDWFDPVQWAAYKLPFSNRADPVFSESLASLLAAIRGKARKCLVLDLDNTVWGGVVGDDGPEGLVVGQGSAMGEAFLAVQRTALDLRRRGVLLAVCSKNDEDNARQPFRTNPNMLLREEHIAAFVANWNDKASNLERIASMLNIGVDALVLLDDNPAERARVRAALPMVGVPELPNDPSHYPRLLLSAGYFEAISFSREDQDRAAQYHADQKRSEIRTGAASVEGYLLDLAMEIDARPFERANIARITQLVNKTNQFNLTTRRYMEHEIVAMMDDPSTYTLQVSLKDRFGDLGMIAVVICRSVGGGGEPSWDIDTWLMSCRVLGRKVEDYMMRRLLADAHAAAVPRVSGSYLPTRKNGMVRDLFERLGGILLEEDDTGARRFVFAPGPWLDEDLPFNPSAASRRHVASLGN